MPVEKLSNLLLAIYRASRECLFTEFQEKVLLETKAILHFDSCTWGTGRMTPQGLVLHSLHLHEEHPERVRLYEEVKKQDLVPDLVRTRPGLTLNVHTPSLYSGKNQKDIRNYARLCGHQNSLVTGWVDPLTEAGRWVGFYRANQDLHFTEHERRLAQLLVPHVMEAFAISGVMHAARLRAADEQGDQCVAISDRLGLLYFMEPGFSELLRMEWSQWEGGILPEALREVLTVSCPAEYRGKKVVVGGTHVNDLVFLRGRRKTAIDNLTIRELEVAKYIATGWTHKMIARKLHISPATVRNHIQRIHQRLGVRNNAELGARLNNGDKLAGPTKSTRRRHEV